MQSHLRAVNRLITRNSTNGKCQKQQPDERERERELGRETHGTRVSPAPRDYVNEMSVENENENFFFILLS